MMHPLRKCLPVYLLICLGLHHALGSEIIHGQKVPENQMLYMASLQNDAGKHVCGGFLIREDFVLTAAHCAKWSPTSVVLGTHNLRKVDNNAMRIRVDTCKHPSYTNISSGHDIMLLKLSKKAKLGKKVQLVQLPKSGFKIKNNAKCRVAGWGYTKTAGNSVDELQATDVKIVNQKTCKKEWKIGKVKLPANIICAGGFKTTNGFCKGDSGGPLVCGGAAAGVVSFSGRRCGDPRSPDVYTRVSSFRGWIRNVMRRN
ncbi:granzyme B(G%2CH)-like [Xyrichtys novacula]|uniref:Granzyme B(G,H)-like n=1 Tax=Xyrichtys novacula TaxID=13765 RepID=A0AAV1FHZ1_XYRNO|nr:granzyme B(G%2CH)-like [Xyrichtys novacula]